MVRALLSELTAAAGLEPATTLHPGNTLVLWVDAQVPAAVLARVAQHRLVSLALAP